MQLSQVWRAESTPAAEVSKDVRSWWADLHHIVQAGSPLAVSPQAELPLKSRGHQLSLVINRLRSWSEYCAHLAHSLHYTGCVGLQFSDTQ
jgi:hypothetical protein